MQNNSICSLYHYDLGKGVIILALVFLSRVSNSQDKNWQRDSLIVDSIYNAAVEYSNRNPKRAGIELQKIITLVDSTLTKKYPSNYFLLSKKATSQHFLAYFKRRENQFDESLQLLLSSIELKKAIGDTLTVPKSLNQIGMLWMYQEEYEHAESYLLDALKMSRDYKTDSETLSILSNLGLSYQHQKQYEKALKMHQQAVALAKAEGSKQDKASTLVNYALLLIVIERYEESLPLIKTSVKYHRELKNDIGLESGLYTMARAYHNLNQYDTAIKYYHEALELSEKINNTALIYSRYSSLSKAYHDIGDDTKALEYYKKYHDFLLERKDLRAVKKMSELESKLKYEKQWALDSIRLKTLEKEKIAQLKTKNRTSTLIFVSVFSVLLILTLVIYLIYKQRIIKAERLAHQKEIKNLELKQEILEKNKKVSSLLAESITHLNEKEKINENLKKISNNEDDRVLLKTVLRDLNVDKLEDNRALLIKQDIEKLNDGFLQKIQNKHFDLTKTKLEISLLIALGLSRRDIAKLRGTTENAVKTTRKRIRKKLDIDSSITLENYFQNM